MVEFKEAFERIALEAKDPNLKPPFNNLDVFNKIREVSKNRELILYGCGVGGSAVAAILNHFGIPFHGVCDSTRTGVFPYTGQNIISPAILCEKHKDAIVLISSGDYEDEIANTLKELGFKDEQVLPFPPPPIFPPALTPVEIFANKHYDGYEWAYGLLSDDLSRSVLLGVVRMHLLGCEIKRSSKSPQYFEEGVIRLKENEVFVDGGSFIGDSVVMLFKECKKVGVNYKKVYSFEADPQSCIKVRNELLYYPNVEVVPKGLWSSETDLVFTRTTLSASSSLASSRAGEKFTVPVTSLDVFFADKAQEDWPTFIKMDIEGAEVEALKGSKEVITAKRPKLALCTYHALEHPYELLRLSHEYCPSYRFFLRQCTDGYYEQVLYAVEGDIK